MRYWEVMAGTENDDLRGALVRAERMEKRPFLAVMYRDFNRERQEIEVERDRMELDRLAREIEALRAETASDYADAVATIKDAETAAP